MRHKLQARARSLKRRLQATSLIRIVLDGAAEAPKMIRSKISERIELRNDQGRSCLHLENKMTTPNLHNPIGSEILESIVYSVGGHVP
jgi:hypothetical protein